MEQKATTYTVGPEDHKLRIDRFLTKAASERSRKEITRLLREGAVLVNGRRRGPGTFVRSGDSLTIRAPERPKESQPKIILKTDSLLAVAKPPGVATNPTPGPRPSLLSWVERQPEIAAAIHSAGIVHRLDRDSSGIVLFSLGPAAHRAILTAFRRRRIEKRYLALIAGAMRPREGTISTPLKRTRSGHVRAEENGLSARSEYRTVAKSKAASLLEMRPVTGRMHQLRVHLASSGRPIAGDPLYGNHSTHLGSPRLWLHCAAIGFPSELAAELDAPTVVSCPLWDDLHRHLATVGIDYDPRKM